MASSSLRLTLRRHAQARAHEFQQQPHFVPHTCEYCNLIVVKLPSTTPFNVGEKEEAHEFPVQGLTRDLFIAAADSDCPLFMKARPEHYDLLFQTHTEYMQDGVGQFFLRISRKDDASTWERTDGEFELFEARITPWYFLGDGFMRYPFRDVSLYIDEGSPIPNWIQTQWQGITSAATLQSLHQAQTWLSECCQSPDHVLCPSPPTSFVPSRLVEIPASSSASTARIIETKGHYRPWCALSYCWGGPQLMRTTISNFHEGQRTLELSAIPGTILDCITTTRAVGLSYLWIDSLCIIQDDPQDLTRELASMPRIYKHATLTISAALAQTCNQGFLHPRAPRLDPTYGPPVRLSCANEHGEEGALILHGTHPPQEHIHTRGWTLQEHLLSPRLLIYSTSSLAWQCRSRKYTDVPHSAPIHDAGLNEFFSSLAKQFYAPELTDEDAIVAWLRIIDVYSGRHLGFASDTLHALSAIAEEFGTRMGVELCGGPVAGAYAVHALLGVRDNESLSTTGQLPRALVVVGEY